MHRFEGKNVIVTGGASGIGRASVLRMVKEGAQVVAMDVNSDGLAETEALAKGMGHPVVCVPCDLSQPGEVKPAVEAAVKRLGSLDALCNVAGILRADHSHELALESWNRVLAVNLTGTFLMCQAAIPFLLATRGAIVNSSSTAALGGHPWMAAYAASKGGILSLTRSLACEYGEQGMRVNCVIPGAIVTPIHNQFRMPKGANANLIRRIIPVVPYAEPEAVASVVAFLASADAGYMNGAEVRVDGGMLS